MKLNQKVPTLIKIREQIYQKQNKRKIVYDMRQLFHYGKSRNFWACMFSLWQGILFEMHASQTQGSCDQNGADFFEKSQDAKGVDLWWRRIKAVITQPVAVGINFAMFVG